MFRGIDRLATAALFLAATLWGGSFIAMKLSIGVYGPMVVLFARMALASFCFLLLVGRFKSERYLPGDWKPLLFMALCEPCLYFLCEAMALTYTSASQAGMVVAILPLMVAVAARFVLNEHLTARTWAGFGLAVVGVFWLTLFSVSSEHAPNPALGNFLEFLAMCCAVGYIITLKRLCARFSPLFLTAVQAFVGCVFFFAVPFPAEHTPARILPRRCSVRRALPRYRRDLRGLLAVQLRGQPDSRRTGFHIHQPDPRDHPVSRLADPRRTPRTHAVPSLRDGPFRGVPEPGPTGRRQCDPRHYPPRTGTC